MSKEEIFVIKRDGSKEVFNIEKINKIINWAIKDIENVSASQIEINAKLIISNGITSQEIHKVLIESTASLISIEEPNYQWVASKLLNYDLRKRVWGGKNPPKLIDLIHRNIKLGWYDKSILDFYTEKDINKINEFIDHERDFNFTYAGIKQLCDKYLVQNRKTKELFETPQFAYILIAATLFRGYDKKIRLEYIKRAYKYFSTHKINLATPVMAGVRTNIKSYSSCCLIDLGDTKESINATNSAVALATASRYGIGVNFGRIRAIGSEIRNGETIHPGVIPFLKITENNVKAWQQAGLRGGSATVTFPIWHYEIEDIIKLKDVGGTSENRIFNLDYSISISKLFYDRFLKDGNITLFSPHEVPDLYESFGLKTFDDLYLKYEKNDKLKIKKIIKARDFFVELTKQRLETGRIYILNIDNVNDHCSWDSDICKSIKIGNLCQEVVQPLVVMQDLHDLNAEIGVCILSAVNWLEIKSEQEHEKVCDIIVRMLDELIDIQEYFNQASRNFATKKRSLGVGITNYAAFLVNNNLKYSDNKTLELTHEWQERQQFYLLKSSCNLAKEKGRCEHFNSAKYSKGILPIDTYKKEIDQFSNFKLNEDWEKLRKDIAEYGLRNCTLSAQMPVESSSVIQNATNGIEPPRAPITFKTSKASTLPVLVPNINKWKEYTYAYEEKTNISYLKIAAILQKFIDMAISVNLYYSPANYEDKKIPYTQIIKETINHWQWGGHTIYYVNTEDGNKHFSVEKDSCSSGACTL